MKNTDYELYKQHWEHDRRDKFITERMFLLPENVFNHRIIRQYMEDDIRFKIVTAARQSYKSEIARRLIYQKALQNANQRYLIGCPIRQQTKKVYWETGFPHMFHPNCIASISRTELQMTLINGTTIELFSADFAKRIEGTPVNGLILDECGNIADLKTIIESNIMPALVATDGFGMFIGVPRQNEGIYYKELYDRYKDGHDKDWKTYTWKAADVMTEKQIAVAMANSDPVSFAVEYGGQFADIAGGLAYYRWNKKLHLRKMDINPSLPLFITFDFNAGIMSPLVGQTINKNVTYIESELVDRNTNVFKITPLVQKKLIELNGGNIQRAKERKTYLYGDKAGNQPSANAKGSSWDELKIMFAGWNVEQRIRTSPHVDRRVSSVNARLQSADDNVHMYFNPTFEESELIKDFNTLSLTALIERKRTLGERSHASDALGYYTHYEYPIHGGNKMYTL
jgi:hypothetical protein